VIPDDLRFTADHEWVRMDDDGTAIVGITHFAQDALGDIVYVDLPDVDRTVAAGEACAEVESVKSVSEIYAPVAGRIIGVNGAVVDAPETVNSDPYGAGWLFRTQPDDAASVAELLDAAAYAAVTDSA
jgi:glycine cleavage system H protein